MGTQHVAAVRGTQFGVMPERSDNLLLYRDRGEDELGAPWRCPRLRRAVSQMPAFTLLEAYEVPVVAFGREPSRAYASRPAAALLEVEQGVELWSHLLRVAARETPSPTTADTTTSPYVLSMRSAVGPAGSFALVVIRPAPPARRCSPPAELGLTRRQVEVARHIARGLPAKQIAPALGISEHTVRRHTERVFAKLGVHSRVAMVAMGRRWLIEDDGGGMPR